MAKHNVPRGDPAAAAGRERAPALRHRARAGREGAPPGPPARRSCPGSLRPTPAASAGEAAAATALRLRTHAWPRSAAGPGVAAPALARPPTATGGTGSRRSWPRASTSWRSTSAATAVATTRPTARYGFDDYVGRRRSPCSRRSRPPPLVIGHSMGGYIAARPGRAASRAHRRRRHHRHPDRVARAISRSSRVARPSGRRSDVRQPGGRRRALQAGAARSPHAARSAYATWARAGGGGAAGR